MPCSVDIMMSPELERCYFFGSNLYRSFAKQQPKRINLKHCHHLNPSLVEITIETNLPNTTRFAAFNVCFCTYFITKI